MKLFVLIYYVAGYQAGGPDSAEFLSKDSCEAAIVQLEAANDSASMVNLKYAICVEK